MQIEVNEIEPCRLSISYSANTDEVEDKLDDVLQAFKKAPVAGFREGKAPVKVIQHKYKEQINASLKQALIEDAYHNILFEEKLETFGQPQVKESSLLNKHFSCVLELNVKPAFDLKVINAYEIAKPVQEMNSEDLGEQIMQELRVKYGEASQFSETDFVQNGDNVIVNYSGKIDGEINDQLTADGEMLTVGASTLESFDDNLLGMVVGEEREFDIVVPQDGLPSLAGKTITFSLEIITGSKIVPAPLDDALAIKVGKSNFEELKSLVASSASSRVIESEKRSMTESISNVLVADYDFEIPNWIVLPEAQQTAARSGIEWNSTTDEDKERFLHVAERNTRLALILDKIRAEYPDAQLSDQEIYDSIKSTMLQFAPNSVNENTIAEEMIKLQKNGQLSVIGARLLEEHTIKHILSLTKVSE